MKLFIATYWEGDSLTWDTFASDGTRKQMEAEFVDIYNKQHPGYNLTLDNVSSVHTLNEVYDHTGGKNYKIVLRAK